MVGTPTPSRISVRREAARREILAAAWDSAHEHGLAALTLRDVAARVGMAPPSLYGYVPNKNAIYSAMFEQAWLDYHASLEQLATRAPTDPRARLLAGAEHFLDFAAADLARYQLMNTSAVPDFRPSEQAYAAAQRAYDFGLGQLPITDPADGDVYTALLAGLASQQLANDPGGDRWRRLLPRIITMFADDLGLPPSE